MLILFCVYIIFIINGYSCVSQIGCSNNSPVGIVNWLKRLYPSSSGQDFHHVENRHGFQEQQHTSQIDECSSAAIGSSEQVIQSRSCFFMVVVRLILLYCQHYHYDVSKHIYTSRNIYALIL